MDFDHRSGNRRNGIAQRNGCVAQSGGIQDDAGIQLKSSFLQFVDKRPFMIGLEIVQMDRRKISFQYFQIRFNRHVAVDVRLPLAEQVEIRAVEDKDVSDHKEDSLFRDTLPTSLEGGEMISDFQNILSPPLKGAGGL